MTVDSARPARLRRLGQAGFVLTDEGSTIIIDPFLSDYPGRLLAPVVTPEELAMADAILVTHEHADHWDEPALSAMPASDVQIVAPVGMSGDVESALAQRVHWVDVGDRITVGRNVAVEVVPALHGRSMEDAYTFGSRFVGYIVQIGSTRIYHAGDSLVFPALAGILREREVDVALLPINGRDAEREAEGVVGNMTADEAAGLVAASRIRAVVPMHFDMFAWNSGSVDDFVEKVLALAPDVQVILPELGEDLTLDLDVRGES